MGRSPVWIGIGILLVSMTLSALWAWNPAKDLWEYWLAVAGVWFTSVGFYLIVAYAVWTRPGLRQKWFLPVGVLLVVVYTVLLFYAGFVVAEPVAILGILGAAAVASWREGDRWGRGLFTASFVGFLLLYGLLVYGARR